MEEKITVRQLKAKEIAFVALFAALIVICSWISVPMVVPFTLQTFAVFVTIGILGKRLGTIAVSVYILLGAVGLPVFAGFKGGISILVGPTGGYIVGFLIAAFVVGTLIEKKGRSKKVMALAMFLGLILCYLFGSLWFFIVYSNTAGSISFTKVLTLCVIPFIIPDILKIVLAVFTVDKLQKHINL